jgi:nickel transport protein
MKNKLARTLLCLSLPWLGWSAPVLAHGTDIESKKVEAVQIEARYEGGQPMQEAQVTVYSPENPAEPWKQGVTDQQGNYTFVPDPQQAGSWEVKVRQAGHGDIITVNVGEETSSTQKSALAFSWLEKDGEYTTTQKVLLGVAGIWGFFGTALFFARSSKTKAEGRRQEAGS